MIEIKLKEGNNGYDAVIDILSTIIPQIYKNYFPGDLIVRIGFKYNEEDDYEYENELLYSSDLADDYSCFKDDWWEGQKYINILGFIPVDDIRLFDFMLTNNKNGYIKAKSEFLYQPYDIEVDLEGAAYEII